MIAIGERKALRLTVMSVLYIAQGIPYGFVTVTFAAYLASHGGDAGQVGDLTALAMLPWSFKWLWAPLVDRFSYSEMGRRRPWIIFAQGMLVTGAGVLIFVPANDVELIGWVVFGCNVFASLQDVSVDALAVDLLPEGERGFANGLMYGGSYLGTMFGGAVLSMVLGLYGLHGALVVQVLALALIMLLPLLLRERVGDQLFSLRSRTPPPVVSLPQAQLSPPKGDTPRPSLLKNLVKAFSRRSPLLAAAFAFLILLGSQTILAVLTHLLMKQLGWSQAEYGSMMGGVPLVLGLSGSVAGGWLADRIGHKTMVAIAASLLGGLWLVFAVGQSLWTDHDFVYAFACGQELFTGTLSAALFALLMGVSWPVVAASQFTAYMALINLGRTVGAKIAGPAHDALDTQGVFFAAGGLQLAILILLLAIDPHQNRRELGHGT